MIDVHLLTRLGGSLTLHSRSRGPASRARRAAFIALMLLVTSDAYADTRQFEVQEWCFSKGIDFEKKEPIDCLANPAEARANDKLYLWMRVSVNQNGIRYLLGLNKLPIYHAWGRNGILEGSTIDVGLDPRQWHDAQRAIKDEIRQRNGIFDWRTYSEKVELIHNGKHYVSVLDARRHPVVLSEDRYIAFRPSIEINLKEN